MSFDTAKRVSFRAIVWNEGETPIELLWEGPDNFDRIQHELAEQLQTKEFGKITREYTETDKVELLYRAFTCPHRGRQIVTALSDAELTTNFEAHQQFCALRVFSPKELYALKPDQEHTNLYHLLKVHLQNDVEWYEFNYDAAEEEGRVVIKTIADICHDGRRTWTLQTVWLDGEPVMVVNSSGRDGDEYHSRFITNLELFTRMVNYLRTFVRGQVDGYVQEDMAIPAMTEFYGGTIHDFYDVTEQKAIPAKVRIG